MRQSWRTTIAGIAAILVGALLLLQGHEQHHAAEGAGLIAAGIGLITARDASQ